LAPILRRDIADSYREPHRQRSERHATDITNHGTLPSPWDNTNDSMGKRTFQEQNGNGGGSRRSTSVRGALHSAT
jgi:hypothetical protein